MIDENEDYFTKSKLAITVKTFGKYNDRSRVPTEQTNKNTQRHRKWQTFRKKKDILKNRHTSRLTVDTRTQRGKQKMKNEALRFVVIEINNK